MKITQAKFWKALKANGINPENRRLFWKDQLHMWNCGNYKSGYGYLMHDNALAILSEIASS